MAKRALWLLNHSTLREFEVPLLLEMGYEVFCPKSFPYDEGNLSASISYAYDSSLSLPPDILEVLNRTDFYHDIPHEQKMIINQYFDIAFFPAFAFQMKMLISFFKGVLCFKPFGLMGEGTYSKNLMLTFGPSFLARIESLRERFIFGQAYQHLSKIEYRGFRNRAVYLPLGLKNAYENHSWTGGEKKVLFVCPRIKTSPYFEDLYKKFKKEFSGVDYMVGGAQPIPVQEDPNVSGFLSKEEYEYSMKHFAVMFYHSQEKNHIHYHPFEAIKNGMPLVFMSGGILDLIGGSKLPGRCNSWREARNKVVRIIEGDKQLVNQIKETQGILLTPFTYDYCKTIWGTSLKKIEKTISTSRLEKNRMRIYKLGLIVPRMSESIWQYTKTFAKKIANNCSNRDIKILIVLGIEHQYEDKCRKDIKDKNIKIRPFEWKTVSSHQIENILKIKGYPSLDLQNEYCLLQDGQRNFEDCNALLLMSPYVPNYLFTCVPYAVIAHDYLQRFDHTILDSSNNTVVLETQRKAEKVLVYHSTTYHDAIQYAGILNENIRSLPLCIDEFINEDVAIYSREKPYFVWKTSLYTFDMHIKILDCLEKYFIRKGKCRCIVLGENIEILDIKKGKCDSAYLKKIQSKIKKSKYLRENLIFQKEYGLFSSIISHASCVIESGCIWNNDTAMYIAEAFHIPIIAAETAITREFKDSLGYDIDFLDYEDTGDFIQVLDRKMQCRHTNVKKKENVPNTAFINIIQDVFGFY